jgi:hypothetical protein
MELLIAVAARCFHAGSAHSGPPEMSAIWLLSGRRHKHGQCGSSEIRHEIVFLYLASYSCQLQALIRAACVVEVVQS